MAKRGIRGWLLSVLVLSAATLGCALFWPPAAPTPQPTPSGVAASATAPAPAATFATTPTVDPLADMESIQGEISTVRGLYPTRALQRELLAPAALRQHVEDDFLADYTPEQAADDARLLALLGLLAPGFDLRRFYLDLYEEQVAGYYDTEDQRMFVVGASWGAMERLTYAHEYVHALQDQTWNLNDGLDYNDQACQEDSERCAAVSALIEGDATLAEEQWWQAYASPHDWDELRAALSAYSGEVYDRAPAYLQQDFLFPYNEGLAFVQALFRKGGWSAVDAAYRQPPTTTEQILHPELYGKDSARQVDLPDFSAALGPGWREIDNDTLGEWFTRLVLDEEIPSWDAEKAAAGWGGDRYIAYFNDDDDQGALVLLGRWDTSRDAFEFVQAFHDYAGWRFGAASTEQTDRLWTWDHGSVALERVHDQSLWIVAPDGETRLKIRQAVEFPVD